MTKTHNKIYIEIHDIWAAFSLLTRLPVPVDHARAGKRGSMAAWAFPIVGIAVGVIAGSVAALLGWLGLPTGMIVVSALAISALLTGAMHEDGLADFVDSSGGATIERRLEIMKDSRVGAYGVVALLLVLAARGAGIAEFSGLEIIMVLAAVGATSRAGIVIIMLVMPSARAGGLSDGVGKPAVLTVLVANGIALLACTVFYGPSGLIVFAVTLLGMLPICWLAQRNLGGQTGDVLGAAQQTAEIAGLAAAIMILT